MARRHEQILRAEGVGDFTLRRSQRAKRVLFRLSPLGELTVVLPWDVDVSRVPELLDKRREWIASCREKLRRRQDSQGEAGLAVPGEIRLKAVEQVWAVEYEPMAGRSVRLRESRERLVLAGAVEDADMVGEVLRSWVANRARVELRPWTQRLAREVGLTFDRVTIRGQRTRWGSCSSRGGVSLNWRLLFLPAEQCRYVLLHELAHLRHMNHSPEYWRLLREWEPRARELDRALLQSWSHVPVWALE